MRQSEKNIQKLPKDLAEVIGFTSHEPKVIAEGVVTEIPGSHHSHETIVSHDDRE
jgi:hypothetical protein